MKKIYALGLLAGLSVPAWAASTPCDQLANLKLPHTEITAATLVAAGAFTPPPNPNQQQMAPPAGAPGQNLQAPGAQPGPMGQPQAGGPGGPGGPGGGQGQQNAVYKTLPAFCHVQASLRPTADSRIDIEVWLPADGWTGRLEAVGNGGFGHNIMFNNFAEGVAKGYVVTGSDTGHQSDDSTFAIGHPEKLVDWGYRAMHENVVAAKAIVAAYYGSAPKYSYYNGCSTGGRQGWVAAEYYPKDFDGLAIGDPANPMTRLQANTIYDNLELTKDEAHFIPTAKWAMIHQTVLAACDEKDGLKDGLVADWTKCNFDPNSLLCKNGDAADCLTASQIESLKVIAGGSKNPRTGEALYPGYPIGINMQGPVVGKNPDNSAPTVFRALFQDANWDYHTFNFDTDTARADKLGNNLINAVDPAKLSQVFAHGGKIILYHGWNDPAITPLISINLYEDAVKANGGVAKTYNDIRLFMVPGMNHCGGGEGPNTFDKLDAISAWVEQGKAPDQIVASHATAGKIDRTRPLCPYPQVAKYKGSGSIDEAANFACAKP
jgi:feruloyl esterase